MKQLRAVSADEFRAMSKKRSKYNNNRGPDYDSDHEASRAQQLALMERNGEITGLREQVKFALVVGHTLIAEYIADFVYVRDGKSVVEDAKGKKTRDYIMKKKLMLAIYKIEVIEV